MKQEMNSVQRIPTHCPAGQAVHTVTTSGVPFRTEHGFEGEL